MKNTMNVLKDDSLAVLRDIKNATLKGISIDYGDELEHTLSQMVVLHFQGFEVSLWTIEKENRPDEYPDLAEILVQKEMQIPSESQGASLVFFKINKKINNIEELIEHVTIQEPGEHPFTLTNTKALLFHLEKGTLVLEKDCYWSECWSVTLLENQDTYALYNQWEKRDVNDQTTYSVTIDHLSI